MTCSLCRWYLCFVELHPHFQAIVVILVFLFYESNHKYHWIATVFCDRFYEMDFRHEKYGYRYVVKISSF